MSQSHYLSHIDSPTDANYSPSYRYLGNFAACEPWAAQAMSCDDCQVSWTGCWDNFQCPRCGKGELPKPLAGPDDTPPTF